MTGTTVVPAGPWAAAAAWRGDPGLLAQAVAAALDATGAADADHAPCHVDVAVPGSRAMRDHAAPGADWMDHETFTSVASFRDGLSRQALTRFVRVGVRVEAADAAVCFELRREPGRGVLLWIEPRAQVPAARLEALRDRVAVSLSRGGFRFTRQPTLGAEGGRNAAEAELKRLQAHRRRQLALVGAGVAIGAGLATAAAVLLLEKVVRLPTVPIVIGSAVTMLVFLFAPRLIFPAVEIAATTPGRRLAQLATRGFGIGSVVSLLASVAGRLLGAK